MSTWNICWLFIGLQFAGLFLGVATDMVHEFNTIAYPTLVLMFLLIMLTKYLV